jgi:hypothetical protein
MMRCKQGDIAVVTAGKNSGKLVSVKEASTQFGLNFWFIESLCGPFTPELSRDKAAMYGHIPDEHLRPIRDKPGEDETLQWLDVPGKVAA